MRAVKPELETMAPLYPAHRILNLKVLGDPRLWSLDRVSNVEPTLVESDSGRAGESRIGNKIGSESNLSRRRVVERRYRRKIEPSVAQKQRVDQRARNRVRVTKDVVIGVVLVHFGETGYLRTAECERSRLVLLGVV